MVKLQLHMMDFEDESLREGYVLHTHKGCGLNVSKMKEVATSVGPSLYISYEMVVYFKKNQENISHDILVKLIYVLIK